MARNGIGQTWTYGDGLGTLSWSGRDDLDRYFDPGPATLSVEADCGDGFIPAFSETVHVVRLGIQSIDFHGADEDDDETHVPLAFHKRSIFETEVSPVGDRPEYLQGESGILGADLDEDDGTPRAVVPTWADPDVPPWADGEVDEHNVPTGYVAGEEVAVTVTLGEYAVSEARSIRVDALGPTPDEAPAVHLLLDGERVSDDPVTPGESVVVMLDAASSTMGKETRTLTWSFEAETDGAWHTLPGAIETTHTMYTLAGPPALLDGTDVGKAPSHPMDRCARGHLRDHGGRGCHRPRRPRCAPASISSSTTTLSTIRVWATTPT